jgi:hypothetical protein
MPTLDQATPLTAADALTAELVRVRRLHDERAQNVKLAAALDWLARWQSRRLGMTYADLAQNPRYAAAIGFFQNDLYGAGDFSRRDADLARVVPMLVRMLPDGVIRTVAAAMELNALSQELDRALLARLPQANNALTVAGYSQAYRLAGNFPLRARQIALVGEVGAALDRFVRMPFLRTALAMMRQPAKLAGLSALQDFLERGFKAFRAMDDARDFLATIHQRETAIMAALVGGASDPFLEVTGDRPGQAV